MDRNSTNSPGNGTPGTVHQSVAFTSQRVASQPTPTFQDSAARCAEKVINYADALSRLGGDRQLFNDMAAFFRDDAPGLMHTIESGIEEHDAPAVTLAAHTLKNMAATCGGEQAAKLAGKVETCARHDDLEGAAQSFALLTTAVEALNEALAADPS